MQASQIPAKFQIPFGKNAAAGTIRPIPVADQTASSPGAASLATGFPIATGQPLASGGIPPALQDFNGILNQDTAWAWWQAAGGTVQFDQAFCTAVGGYPQGALLNSATTPGILWVSTADNNTTNPDSNFAQNWISVSTTVTPARGLVTSGSVISVPHNVSTDVTNYTSVALNLPSSTYSNGVLTIGGGDAGFYIIGFGFRFPDNSLAFNLFSRALINNTAANGFSQIAYPNTNFYGGTFFTSFTRLNAGDQIKANIVQQNTNSSTYNLAYVGFNVIRLGA